jgi:hypothetical protein
MDADGNVLNFAESINFAIPHLICVVCCLCLIVTPYRTQTNTTQSHTLCHGFCTSVSHFIDFSFKFRQLTEQQAHHDCTTIAICTANQTDDARITYSKAAGLFRPRLYFNRLPSLYKYSPFCPTISSSISQLNLTRKYYIVFPYWNHNYLKMQLLLVLSLCAVTAFAQNYANLRFDHPILGQMRVSTKKFPYLTPVEKPEILYVTPNS